MDVSFSNRIYKQNFKIKTFQWRDVASGFLFIADSTRAIA